MLAVSVEYFDIKKSYFFLTEDYWNNNILLYRPNMATKYAIFYVYEILSRRNTIANDYR
jgi:hypothetical protein